MNPKEATEAWHRFATTLEVHWRGSTRTWDDHISGNRYTDEEELVQPRVFPKFAEGLLKYTVGLTLAPERSGQEGKPDFTPADPVTHPFVFEVKSTTDGIDLKGHIDQVRKYLRDGRPRIQKVALTNLIGLRVFSLDENGRLQEEYSVNLLGLLEADPISAASTPDAERLRRFLVEFEYQALGADQKLDRVRKQPDWNPLTQITDSDWLSARLDSVVQALTEDVTQQIRDGAFGNAAKVFPEKREGILDEIQELEWRLGGSLEDVTERKLADYVSSRAGTTKAKALRQYAAHVAYYTTTRLLLVRTWEDLELLNPVLYDGGFDKWMERLDEVVDEVVQHSFIQAKSRYRSLFERRNNYTWYEPSPAAYAEAIYQLANTYFGEISSDVLGQVYERLLERVDRKLLGQYYTPRDVIEVIWDLIDGSFVDEALEDGRVPRVLDIATGSAGFLVEIANRLRSAMENREDAGASVDRQWWVNAIADGLTGVEIQRFPAYLAELNLLIQLGHVLADAPTVRLPPLGVLPTDSLTLHNPVELFDADVAAADGDYGSDLLMPTAERFERASRVKDPFQADYLMDVACGNPPYVGENRGGELIRRTQERFPYWQQYAGHHMDYLYWFLILGISKLRNGGRFGFITTEYWLRAIGAKALRKYIARRCRIDRIVLFRDFRLFPDAPGQHSMVISGERTVPPDDRFEPDRDDPGTFCPVVSVYRGAQPRTVKQRRAILSSIQERRSAAGVKTFKSVRSPNVLGEQTWAEVCLTPSQVRNRERLRESAEALEINPEQGIQTNADRMRKGYDESLPKKVLEDIGWPEERHGIFVLTRSELQSLGTLTQKEKDIIRPVINTKNLFPYAAVPPEDGDVVLYLDYPESVREGQGKALHEDFPEDMTNVKDHLERFRPLLEEKVRTYSEEDKRPWWSIHRPKPQITSLDRERAEWADYCVTARWGVGETLLVGMAPSGSAPLSGIYSLLTEDDVPGAYVCGVLNATAVQELAETLPPGVVRSKDLEEIGVPYVEEEEHRVVEATINLANLTWDMVRNQSHRFPTLPECLQTDIALAEIDYDIWVPAEGPPTEWGALEDLRWVDRIDTSGSISRKIKQVRVDHDLFGLGVKAEHEAGGISTVYLATPSEDLAETVARYLRGAGAQGRKIREVKRLQAPIDSDSLVNAYQDDRTRLETSVEEYHELRSRIDEVVDAVL